MQARTSDIQVARVLSESDDSLIIEVVKNKDAVFTLDENPEENRFLTLFFVHNTASEGEPPSMMIWTPWES